MKLFSLGARTAATFMLAAAALGLTGTTTTINNTATIRAPTTPLGSADIAAWTKRAPKSPRLLLSP